MALINQKETNIAQSNLRNKTKSRSFKLIQTGKNLHREHQLKRICYKFSSIDDSLVFFIKKIIIVTSDCDKFHCVGVWSGVTHTIDFTLASAHKRNKTVDNKCIPQGCLICGAMLLPNLKDTHRYKLMYKQTAVKHNQVVQSKVTKQIKLHSFLY